MSLLSADEMNARDLENWRGNLQLAADWVGGLCNVLEWGHDAVYDGLMTEEERAAAVESYGFEGLFEEALEIIKREPDGNE